MPAFDLLNFKWNITPPPHVGNGDPFRYLWYRKKVHESGELVTTMHTTVEVGVDGYYVGDFSPSLTLVQYSSARDGAGMTMDDSIQLNVASSDEEGDVVILDALFGDTWRDFLNQVSHAAREQHALAVSRGELAEPTSEEADSDVDTMLTSALELSRAAASQDHGEYDDALGGLFVEFEGDASDEAEVLVIDPNAGLVMGDYTDGRQGVSRRLSLDVQPEEVYVDDSPTEVMRAVAMPGTEGAESDDRDGEGTAADTVASDSDSEGTTADDSEGTTADTVASDSEGTTAGDGDGEGDEDDALPADLRAVLDKYGPDVLAKLLDK